MKSVLVLVVGCASALPLDRHAAADERPSPDGWEIGVGAGIVSTPRSLGSDSQKTFVVPNFDVRYKDWFIANPVEGVRSRTTALFLGSTERRCSNLRSAGPPFFESPFHDRRRRSRARRRRSAAQAIHDRRVRVCRCANHPPSRLASRRVRRLRLRCGRGHRTGVDRAAGCGRPGRLRNFDAAGRWCREDEKVALDACRPLAVRISMDAALLEYRPGGRSSGSCGALPAYRLPCPRSRRRQRPLRESGLPAKMLRRLPQ